VDFFMYYYVIVFKIWIINNKLKYYLQHICWYRQRIYILLYVVIWWKYLGILIKEFVPNKSNILKYVNKE